MDRHLTESRLLAVIRAALGAVAASLTVFGLTLLLKRVDVAVPQARDAILALLGLALVITAGALDAKEWPDRAPDTNIIDRAPWHEYEGSFRGMIG